MIEAEAWSTAEAERIGGIERQIFVAIRISKIDRCAGVNKISEEQVVVEALRAIKGSQQRIVVEVVVVDDHAKRKWPAELVVQLFDQFSSWAALCFN